MLFSLAYAHVQKNFCCRQNFRKKQKQFFSLVTDEFASGKVMIFHRKANQKNSKLVRTN